MLFVWSGLGRPYTIFINHTMDCELSKLHWKQTTFILESQDIHTSTILFYIIILCAWFDTGHAGCARHTKYSEYFFKKVDSKILYLLGCFRSNKLHLFSLILLVLFSSIDFDAN